MIDSVREEYFNVESVNSFKKRDKKRFWKRMLFLVFLLTV